MDWFTDELGIIVSDGKFLRDV